MNRIGMPSRAGSRRWRLRPRAWSITVITALLAAGSLLGSAAPAAASTRIVATASGPATASLSDFGQPFHFLSPLGVESGDPTKFDASLLNELVVSICRLDQTGCTPLKTLTSGSSLSERLRYGPATGTPTYYLGNWDTSTVKLAPSSFRVTVSVDRLVLGSLDLGPATYKSFGRTWPIKFRVENNPTIRARVLREAGKSCSQIANVLKNAFALGPDDVRTVLAGDIDPCSQHDIDIAVTNVFQTVRMPATTKIADTATQNVLTSFDPASGQMSFSGSTAVLANLKVGDMLVSEPGANAPNGYLRKVTSITKSKKSAVIVLGTTQAKIDEAISQGTLDADGALQPADLLSTQAAPGVTLREPGATTASSASLFGPADVSDGFDFHESIDFTLNGSTGDPDLGGTGTVHFHGQLKFNAGYNIGLGVEACLRLPPVCVDRFEAHLGAHMYSDLHVDGTFDGHLHKEYVLSTHYFKPIVLMIGPFPFIVVPVVKAIAGIDGNAHVTFNFEAQATSDLSLGAKWTDPDDGGSGWKADPWPPTISGPADATARASMDIRGYAAAEAKLLLYGAAGPGFSGHLGLWGHVEVPHDPLWTVYGIVQGDLNFSVDLGAILTVAEFHHPLPEWSVALKSSENQPPDCSTTGGLVPAEPGAPTFVGPRTGDNYQGYFACADPEGGDVTYTATTDDTTPARTIASNSDHVTGTWATPGTYHVHVTASDPSGATKAFDLTVDVRDAAPILSLVTASTTVPAGVQYWVTASAFHPSQTSPDNGDFMDCSTMTWDVPGATVRPYASHRVCSAVIVFDAPGPHTVTVTATDAFNKSDVKTINVNVTPAPANPAPEVAFGTFNVDAATGPIRTCQNGDVHCDDACLVGVDCPVPMDALLYNGSVGNYHGPLTFWLTASDPNGEHVTVTWHCVVASFSYAITDNGDGTFSCDPYSSTITQPILVWADVSDGTTTVHSEVRRMYMLDRVA